MASGEGDEETTGNVPPVDIKEVFQKKYFALKKMCEQVQQKNERLVNRIHQMKRMIRKYKQERGLLMAKLDHCNDGYSEAQVPASWEEGPSAELEPSSVANGDTEDTKVSVDPGSLLPEATKSAVAAAAAVAASHPAEQASSSSSSSTGTAGSSVDRARTDVPKPAVTCRKTATGFLLFCQHRRHEIQEKFAEEEGHEMPQEDLVRNLTQQWTSLPVDKKRVYQDLAANLTTVPPSSSTMKALQEQSPSAASLLGLQ